MQARRAWIQYQYLGKYGLRFLSVRPQVLIPAQVISRVPFQGWECIISKLATISDHDFQPTRKDVPRDFSGAMLCSNAHIIAHMLIIMKFWYQICSRLNCKFMK